MAEKTRVGIYGGTFNPPHIAHVKAAERFMVEAALDRLIIIPSFVPPHKEYSGNVTPEERLEMCKIAFGHIHSSEVSDIEIQRGGKSYTAVTLSELSSSDCELYFLCGTDMFLTLDSWYCPERIFNLATICYIRRESDEQITERLAERTRLYTEKFGARIIAVDTEAIEVSSTEIREAILSGTECSMLQPAVFDYIKLKGLYK